MRIAICLIAVLCITTPHLHAEQLLVQNVSGRTIEHLGTQKDATTFRLCDKREIPIGNGTVKDTTRKCSGDGIRQPVTAPYQTSRSKTFQVTNQNQPYRERRKSELKE